MPAVWGLSTMMLTAECGENVHDECTVRTESVAEWSWRCVLTCNG